MTPKKLLSWCLWGIVILLIVPIYLRAALEDPVDYMRGGVGANDFKAYYVASRLLARGQDPYSVSLSWQEMDALGLPQDNILYMYPSMLAIAALPFADLSIENAARIWNVMNLGWLIGAIILLTVTLKLHQILRDRYVWFVILFAISVPATGAIRAGQANVLLLFLLTLALYAYQQKRFAWAGSAIGVAALIKVFPGVLLAWWFWKRQWRSVIWGIGTIAALLILCGLFLAATGRETLNDLRFFLQILPQLTAPVQRDNQSLYGFFSHFDLPLWAIRIGSGISSVLVIVVTLITLVRAPKEKTDLLQYGLIVTTVLLVSTITWSTTNILLLLPIAILVQSWVIQRRPRVFWMLLGIVYLSLGAVRWFASPQMDPTVLAWVLGLGTIGMLIIWGLVLYEIALARSSLHVRIAHSCSVFEQR